MIQRITSALMILVFFVFLTLATSCGASENQANNPGSFSSDIDNLNPDGDTLIDDQQFFFGLDDFPSRQPIINIIRGFREAISETEQAMIRHGLTDIQELDPSIFVELKYSTTDNFFGKNVYGGMQRAYLQPEVAERLVTAQRYLQQIRPGYSLIVYDAARPRSVQQLMWDSLDAPFEEKIRFLSNPLYGSVHNFGAAVDVSILGPDSIALDMGTPFDYMGLLAYPSHEDELLEEGLLTLEQVENRRLLRHVMWQGGFWGIQSEWWHFNAFTRAQARERFEIIE